MIKSPKQSTQPEACSFGQFFYREGLATVLYKSIGPAIIALCLSGCPSAIQWPVIFNALRAFAARIVTIVIFAIKLQTEGLSQGSKKGNEVILPSVAHHHASTAIIAVRLMLRLKAAALGGSPSTVLNRMRIFGSLPVLYMLIAVETPAAFSARCARSTFQRGTTDHDFIPTIAATQPSSGAIFSGNDWRSSQNEKALKSLFGQIYAICGGAARIVISHLDLLFRSVVRPISEVTFIGGPFFYSTAEGCEGMRNV